MDLVEFEMKSSASSPDFVRAVTWISPRAAYSVTARR
jgi:hypothetical protein